MLSRGGRVVASLTPLDRYPRESHRQAVPGAQRQREFRFNGVTGNKLQAVALRYGSQDQLRLHHGKVLANTQAWTTAEWEVGVVWAASGGFGGEALRVKHLWRLPENGLGMCRAGTETNHTAPRDSRTHYS